MIGRTGITWRAGWSVGVLLAVLAAGTGEARAAGHDLTGRLAPGISFSDGVNGVAPKTTLSSFRGRVVWIKFVLRDCPMCVQSLPRAQDLHERWGGSGLVVLVVMHQHPPAGFDAIMRRGGYTFRVGTDPQGLFAQAYGVGSRPTDYVVGIDGRVKASNAAPDEVILTELGHYRLARLGRVPNELSGARDAVWRWDYGAALKTAEAAAAKAGATSEVRGVRDRLTAQASEELDARVVLAGAYERKGDVRRADAILDRLTRHFEGTSLGAKAAEALRLFRARTGR